jgi:hypothetical protein
MCLVCLQISRQGSGPVFRDEEKTRAAESTGRNEPAFLPCILLQNKGSFPGIRKRIRERITSPLLRRRPPARSIIPDFIRFAHLGFFSSFPFFFFFFFFSFHHQRLLFIERSASTLIVADVD